MNRREFLGGAGVLACQSPALSAAVETEVVRLKLRHNWRIALDPGAAADRRRLPNRRVQKLTVRVFN